MNFGGNEVVYNYQESEIVIVPVPYDETSTWMKGADKGPDAILNASVNLEFYDIETASEAHLKGIYTVPPILQKESPESLTEDVYYRILTLLSEKKFPVIIGGNHTVSIGSVKAFSEFYYDLSVLQLDAHSDLRQEYEGSKLNHACAMARAREFAPIVQVGIRSMSAEELPFVERDRMFYSHELYNDKNLYKKAIDKLSENVYITIDLDVFDPSLLPSTGTPEPGGLCWYQVMKLLASVSRSKQIVGFDVVELCPSEHKAPDFLAAKLIYKLLSYIHANKPSSARNSSA